MSCFNACFAALHTSAISPMQSTTLSYSINYSILRMFNAKLKLMHKRPFIDQHCPRHQHRCCLPPVQDEHPHLPKFFVGVVQLCASPMVLFETLPARQERPCFLPDGNLAYQISSCSINLLHNVFSLLAKVSTKSR